MKIQRLPTYAEILHCAADNCLWDGSKRTLQDDSIKMYSCIAIDEAVDRLLIHHIDNNTLGSRVLRHQQWYRRGDAIKEWLRKMGVDPGSNMEFDSIRWGRAQQSARYLWLKFAAMIAEEENR